MQENAELQAEPKASADYRILDLVRSIAVLLVVFRHVFEYYKVHETAWFQEWPFGTSGVLIFFVHTSLVLMFSMMRSEAKEAQTGTRAYVSFMIRRIFRIYPLSMLAILLAYFVFGVAMKEAQTIPALLANLALVQNFIGYENVLVPLWSLPLEMAMYLLLPIFFFAMKKRAFPVAIGATVLAFAGAYLEHKFKLNQFFAYAPCFMGGILAYSLWFKSKRFLAWWWVPIYLGVAVIAYMAFYAKTGMRGVAGAPMCIGLGFILAFAKDMPTGWLSRTAKQVATYSYGIYLFHELFFRYFVLRVFGYTEGQPVKDAAVFLPLGIALVCTGIASVASFHLIEQPMIRVGQRIASSFRGRRKVALESSP
jgi:peptidoglycan/LPS O-acetylase OafA/YrhL